MDTLGIGPTDLGSLSISHPYTDAPGMTPTLVHGPILHASRLPGRHEKTRLLPLTKATRTHAAHPAGQVVKTGKGLTFSLGDDACRHGWPDAAQGLQLFGRGTVGVDGGDGIRNVSGHHHGGWRSIRGQIRRPCRSTACQQPRKQQKRRQKRPEDGNEPGKSARGWRQGGPCPEDGLHGELPSAVPSERMRHAKGREPSALAGAGASAKWSSHARPTGGAKRCEGVWNSRKGQETLSSPGRGP